MAILLPIIIGLASIIVPGLFLALALLRKTGLPLFEIAVIGFMFGLIFPPTMIWLESYLIPLSSAFYFSNGLYNINIVILTVIGIAACYWQGALGSFGLPSMGRGGAMLRRDLERDHKKRIDSVRRELASLSVGMKVVKEHQREEDELIKRHSQELDAASSLGQEERGKIIESHAGQERRLFEEHEAEEKQLIGSASQGQKTKDNTIIWLALLVVMILVFATRMLSIGEAPRYFEFDPYYDMMSTQFILTYGYQLLYSHSAWPTLVNGTVQRIQPIVPYLEAYWYNLAGATPSSTTLNTTLLSQVSSYYPPIMAALLVFVIFMFLYHEYGEFVGLIGAGLAATMPVLLTTFIAGEQLLEPWGIFAMFFFYAAYLLAINKPEDPRLAIFAGIAFASNFLGAHYYTVTAGILAGYILLQGVVNVMRRKDNTSFYKMNAIVIIVSVVFYLFYNAYAATLTERTASILGIPIIIGFAIFALAGVFVLDIVVKRLIQNRELNRINSSLLSNYAVLAILFAFLVGLTVLLYAVIGYVIFIAPLVLIEVIAYPVIAQHLLRSQPSHTMHLKMTMEVLMALGAVALIVIFLTPFGKPFFSYIQLSKTFTTPSSPLFMTVQEYAPTGANYDFGNGGFGLIGTNIGGVNIIIWAVLIAFSVLTLLAIYRRDSKSSILTYAAVWPVAVAGLIEVKYLPHFGVGYIIAIGVILGELGLHYSGFLGKNTKNILYAAGALILLIEFLPMAYQLVTAAANPSCSAITNAGNQLGSVLYCNTVPNYWLDATAWMRQNAGPYAPRILSWWDYGDWINWFGNSNAVIRGDNSVPATDYAVAAHYVMTSSDGYTPQKLASFMDGLQAKWILFDDQLVPKWGALDFLACIDTNGTSYSYAVSQGKTYGQPYVLGTSGCELRHDPAYIFIPVSENLSSYCQLPGNVTTPSLKGFEVVGSSATNATYCIPQSFFSTGNSTYLMYQNGTKSNAFITSSFFGGSQVISGTQFISFMLLYAPNGPNDTITNAPSEFYNSTYYRGFFLGRLQGLTLVYPSNFSGINYMNGTNPIMIYQLNNYTGTQPYVVPKPKGIGNNYTIPG